VIEEDGYPLESVAIAHIYSSFVYRGNGDYNGFFHPEDVTDTILKYRVMIPDKVAKLQNMFEGDEPDIKTGVHSQKPFGCLFREYWSTLLQR